MRAGKISESVLKRSVLRQIQNSREKVIKGAGVGEDCAFLWWDGHETDHLPGGCITAVSMETITLPVKNAAYLAVMAAANNLAAAGAIPVATVLSLTLPSEAEEAFLKELMRQAQICCEELDIQIVGGHTEISDRLTLPVITSTVMGKMQDGFSESSHDKKEMQMDIVVTKWIGLEGTSIIAREKERELAERYPIRLVLDAQKQEKYLSVASEAAIALKSGVYAMHDVRSGGIFGALWELSQKIGVGLCIDLKKIPVKQETIEICEFYHLNPYELLSGGALLIAAHDGNKLVRELEAAGIPASVIGNTNHSKDRIIRNQDEIRYLEPTVPDEILKIKFD